MRDPALPADPPLDTVRYAGRPGLCALPADAGVWLTFALLQALALTALISALWSPAPRSADAILFSAMLTAFLFAAWLLIILFLIRRAGGSIGGLVAAPFIRLTVSDRRIVWDVPWRGIPLIEIGADRVRGALLGEVDARGRGPAAIVLVPGDHAGDGQGMVHFSRLPRAAAFADAVSRLE